MAEFKLLYTTEDDSIQNLFVDYSFEQLNGQEIRLPEGISNIKLILHMPNTILNLKSVRACAKATDGSDFWYDLSFQTDGFRLGHNLFLLNQDEITIEPTDFRYRTVALLIEMEKVELSEESTEKLAHSTERLISDAMTMEDKWNFQREVYDQKVEEVVRLEADKVELNEAIETLRDVNNQWEARYNDILNSFSWKITKPIRDIKSKLSGRNANSPLKEMQRSYEIRLQEVGEEQAKKEFFSSLIEEDMKYMQHQRMQVNAYEASDRELGIGKSGAKVYVRQTFEEEKIAAESLMSDGGASFSLFAVLRDESLDELKRFLHLIEQQTYANFELIVLDQTDDNHKCVSKALKWYASLDNRIRVISGDRSQDIKELKEERLKNFLQMPEKEYAAWIEIRDILHPSALYECARRIQGALDETVHYLYTDSAVYTERLKDIVPSDTWYKPDFSPVLLEGENYIRNLWIVRTETIKNIDTLPPSEVKDHTERNAEELLANHRYGLILSTDETAVHIPECLYYEKKQQLSPEAQMQNVEFASYALENYLSRQQNRKHSEIRIIDTEKALFQVKYQLKDTPLISIMIPNKDHVGDLKRCIDSIREKSTYENYEIVVVENNSSQKETFDYYEELEQSKNARVIQWKDAFNYASINNWGEKKLKGEYVLLLNNDTFIITPDWIQEMMQYALRPEVGAVGAKLYYVDDTIQHAGVIIGLGGVAAHSHKDYNRGQSGYMNRLQVAQNLSAVTAACILMRRSVYEEIGGMNEGYEVAFNDADFCMRIRSAGYQVVFTPFAELYHDESKSRGAENTPEKAERFESEVQRFKAEWPEILQGGDPFYNPNLTTAKEDFDIREELKG